MLQYILTYLFLIIKYKQTDGENDNYFKQIFYIPQKHVWMKKKICIKTSTYPQLTDRQNYIYKRFGSTQLTSNG
jgi:hypothetical protein